MAVTKRRGVAAVTQVDVELNPVVIEILVYIGRLKRYGVALCPTTVNRILTRLTQARLDMVDYPNRQAIWHCIEEKCNETGVVNDALLFEMRRRLLPEERK